MYTVLLLVFIEEFRDKCSSGVLVGISVSGRFGYILHGEYHGCVCLLSGVDGLATQI